MNDSTHDNEKNKQWFQCGDLEQEGGWKAYD